MQKVPAQDSSVEWNFVREYKTSLSRFILSVVVLTLKIRERGNSLSTQKQQRSNPPLKHPPFYFLISR